MNVEYFISKKLFTAKEKNNSYTRPILRIAILAIALSVAVMLIAVMVLTGFKNDISSKIIGFGSHITINNFTNNQSYESESISINQDFYPSINDWIISSRDSFNKDSKIDLQSERIVESDKKIKNVVEITKSASKDPEFNEKFEKLAEVVQLHENIINGASKDSAEIIKTINEDLEIDLQARENAELAYKEIKNINVFATKAAIIKTTNEIHGVVLKGVSYDYDWTFFNDNLVAGEVLNLDDSIKSNNILISEEVSKLLELDVSDDLVMYFIQDPARVRRFKIKGIYNTDMLDFDRLYVLGDIKHIQALNSWEDTQVGGFEISINNFDHLDVITDAVYQRLAHNLNAESIKDKQPQIFAWLSLQDVNVRVILILMLLVGAINMITALLILILDRTRLIGILKALGAANWSVRKIFLYSAVHLILKGLILGNAIAFVFAFLQKEYSLISLDPETYYMNTVPINFDFMLILMLNIGTIIICYLILIIPSLIITKITPIKAIRFE